MHKKAKLLAILPAFWTCLFHTVIIITHQSNEYWKGNLNTSNSILFYDHVNFYHLSMIEVLA